MNRSHRWWLSLACLLWSSVLLTPAAWAACPASYPRTTPDSDFTNAGNGMVQHTPTGLIWKRCAEGQSWDGSTCTGAAATYTWQEAFERVDAVNSSATGTENLGQTDWRLPNINELKSLAEEGCYKPAINLTQFPNTPALDFWSASPVAGNSSYAWYVGFDYGNDYWFYQSSPHRVRLVRAGQSFLSFDGAPGSVTVRKALAGAAAGSVSAATAFPITLTCGATTLGPVNATTTTSAVFDSVPAGNCTVSEGTLPTIAGVTWETPSYNPANPITVTAGNNSAVTVTNTANWVTYAITATANPTVGGTVSCSPNPVNHGSDSSCTASPNAGYTFSGFSGDCSGATCVLSNVTGTRSVTANFTLNSYAITATASPTAGGTVSCSPNPVNHGSDSSCTASPNAGYTFSGFSGDCSGTTCVLSNVTGPRSVTALFTLNSYAITVIANPAAGGTVSCSPNPVPNGGDSTCTATPNPGYTFSSWSGDCTGTGACALSNITSAKSVTANFSVAAQKTYTGPTATGTGNATATVTGGGDACGFSDAQFIPLSSVAAAPPAEYHFPHGLFKFTLTQCTVGGTVTLSIRYPAVLPETTRYWKYGPTADQAEHWYPLSQAAINGATVTFNLTDGGLGDNDLKADGTISDPSGPAVPATDIPTLSEWAMLILLSLLLGIGIRQVRRREMF